MNLAFVDWTALWQAAAAAFVAGVGVAFSFSLAIFGAARSSDERRLGRGIEALAATLLMIVGLALSLAAVVAGVLLMING